MKTNTGNKDNLFWQVLFAFKPLLYTFKKQNLRLILDLEGGFTSIQYSADDKSRRYLDFYGLNSNEYTAKNDSGNANPVNNLSVYGGLGVVYDKNQKISPYISLKFGYNYVNNSYVRIYPKLFGINYTISRAEELSGPGMKIDIGVYLFGSICFSYNFYSFKATKNNSVLNAVYTGHFLNFAIAGPNF
jgi:hypothetical protein